MGSVRGSLLVVDDERAVRQVTAEVLRREGFEVLAAADGHEALKLFGQQRGQVIGVVLDLTLPTLSGEEVLQALRSEQPDLPVIVSSGYPAEQVLEALKAQGEVRVLSKPYTPAQLLQSVRAALG